MPVPSTFRIMARGGARPAEPGHALKHLAWVGGPATHMAGIGTRSVAGGRERLLLLYPIPRPFSHRPPGRPPAHLPPYRRPRERNPADTSGNIVGSGTSGVPADLRGPRSRSRSRNRRRRPRHWFLRVSVARREPVEDRGVADSYRHSRCRQSSRQGVRPFRRRRGQVGHPRRVAVLDPHSRMIASGPLPSGRMSGRRRSIWIRPPRSGCRRAPGREREMPGRRSAGPGPSAGDVAGPPPPTNTLLARHPGIKDGAPTGPAVEERRDRDGIVGPVLLVVLDQVVPDWL